MTDEIHAQNLTALSAQAKLRVIRYVFLGGLLVVVVLCAVAVGIGRRSQPPLTRLDFETAQEKWLEEGPADYLIEIEVEGTQPAVYEVEVENRQAVRAMRNGHPLRQQRTWATWSVPGMFDTLASDLGMLERKERPLVVRCQFDPQYGYPASYQRLEPGASHEVAWVVVRFEPH